MSDKQNLKLDPKKRSGHVILATHSSLIYKESLPIHWGEKDPMKRGPVVGSLTNPKKRNSIGTHSGSYTVYRALSMAIGAYDHDHVPDLHNTQSPTKIGPYPQWFDKNKMVSIDPWGLDPQVHFKKLFDQGYDIRPTIAVTQAHLQIPEIEDAIRKGRLKKDGKIVRTQGDVSVTKVALDPVWYLPGIATKLGVGEGE
ncbi:MAG: GTP cyclohydrolase II, partial [Bdellovibrionota bacterium]